MFPEESPLWQTKGFDIQDLLVSHGLLLNIPPFKGSTPLGITDVHKTQTIAWICIHVERGIGQVKCRYNILQGVIPLVTAGSLNQIWTVCCMLTNFRGPIIDEELTYTLTDILTTQVYMCFCIYTYNTNISRHICYNVIIIERMQGR